MLSEPAKRTLYHYFDEEYKYTGFFKNGMWMSSFSNLDDKMEGKVYFLYEFKQQKYHKLKKRYLFDVSSLGVGIFCLTSKNDSRKMWKDYAKNGKGLCIGLTLNVWNEKTQYKDDLCELHYLQRSNAPWAERTIYYTQIGKGKDTTAFLADVKYGGGVDVPYWLIDGKFEYVAEDPVKIVSYKYKKFIREDETRFVIIAEGGSNKSYEIPKCWVKEVIFGNRMDKKEKESVIALIDDIGGYDLTYYEEKSDKGTIMIVPLIK